MILANKSILITGGTGSLGKILVKRILSGELGTPKKVVVFSRDEAKQNAMRIMFSTKNEATDEIIYRNFMQCLQFRIGNVRSYADVSQALKGIDIVINAAALKQVPTCEYFPYQAIQTNCQGAYNIIRAIHEFSLDVDTVVGVSTDKATQPINVMGMSKALQERIFISANIDNPHTRFICVRYGNVLASRGSVIPLFRQQILAKQAVTITDERMTRFLLSINEAVDTIFAALQYAQTGDIVIPRVPATTIVNVAKALIGERDIEIKLTGIRPGEKIHEILISEQELPFVLATEGYYFITSMLPEIRAKTDRELESPLDKPYSSEHDNLNLQQTEALLSRHQLLLQQKIALSDGELLV